MIYRSDLFSDLDAIFNSFFYNFPKEVKPPAAYRLLKGEDGKVTSFLLQVAVAGFEEKDLKVWSEDNVLFISGDNTKNKNVLEKFQKRFSWEVPTSDDICLEDVKVTFENGLLSLDIPVKKKVKNKTFLLGGQ